MLQAAERTTTEEQMKAMKIRESWGTWMPQPIIQEAAGAEERAPMTPIRNAMGGPSVFPPELGQRMPMNPKTPPLVVEGPAVPTPPATPRRERRLPSARQRRARRTRGTG
mgnify:CR=1 FL=1